LHLLKKEHSVVKWIILLRKLCNAKNDPKTFFCITLPNNFDTFQTYISKQALSVFWTIVGAPADYKSCACESKLISFYNILFIIRAAQRAGAAQDAFSPFTILSKTQQQITTVHSRSSQRACWSLLIHHSIAKFDKYCVYWTCKK